PPRVLHEYELPAHLPALRDGSAVGVMPSYNLVNGRPAHLSPLIDAVLRPAAPDPLLVVSDAHAPGTLAGLRAFPRALPTACAHPATPDGTPAPPAPRPRSATPMPPATWPGPRPSTPPPRPPTHKRAVPGRTAPPRTTPTPKPPSNTSKRPCGADSSQRTT